MTKAARVVLEDCRGALAEIDGTSGPTWRRRYVTAVVLLRTVGYVLDRIDATSSAAMKQAIDRAWANLKLSRPNPAIFWGFIDQERQKIAHQYQIDAGQSVTVFASLPTVWLNPQHAPVTPEEAVESRPAEYGYHVHAEPFAGRDQREVIAEAIAWWENYLDEIDREAGSATN